MIVHGSITGYQQELNGSLKPCEDCKRARRLYLKTLALYRVAVEAEKYGIDKDIMPVTYEAADLINERWAKTWK